MLLQESCLRLISSHNYGENMLESYLKFMVIFGCNTCACLKLVLFFFPLPIRSTITREKFEELCGDLWDKSLLPVKELLKHSGLQTDDIYAVELIGGATRVPKLQVCTTFSPYFCMYTETKSFKKAYKEVFVVSFAIYIEFYGTHSSMQD